MRVTTRCFIISSLIRKPEHCTMSTSIEDKAVNTEKEEEVETATAEEEVLMEKEIVEVKSRKIKTLRRRLAKQKDCQRQWRPDRWGQ